MSPGPDHDADPRERPADPAGTQPKHDPANLLPARRDDVVESTADEESRQGDLLPEPREAAGVGAPRTGRKHSEHAPRFQFLTGALLAVAVASVVGVVLLTVGNPVAKKRPAWSPWKPTGAGVTGAKQIADRVGAQYRDGGTQLVDVQTNGLAFKGVQLAVALRQSPDQGGNIQIHDDDGVLYQLCGLGPDCAIDRGKPSRRRAFLLKREGLELALYSLHYLGVKQVVVLLPPPPGRAQTVAMYFRKADVGPQLDRPLPASLAPRAPTVKTVTTSPDASLVQQTTKTNYLFSLMGSSFNDRAFLVLDPYTATADAKLQKSLTDQKKAALAAAASAPTPTPTPTSPSTPSGG